MSSQPVADVRLVPQQGEVAPLVWTQEQDAITITIRAFRFIIWKGILIIPNTIFINQCKMTVPLPSSGRPTFL